MSGDGRRPDVFAHRQAEHDSVEIDRFRHWPGREYPLFVKDPVVRKEPLVVNAGQRSVVEHSGGVEDVVVLVDEAHNGREPPRGASDVVEGAQIPLDEGRLEQQVLGRIAGHG
jgi:hypothetical protein